MAERKRQIGRVVELGSLSRSVLHETLQGSIVVLPLGSIEQHGPNLSLDLDLQHVEWIARAAIKRVGSRAPIVLAPSLAYGSSEHHVPIGGAVSVTTRTYYDLLTDIGTSLARSGARRLFLLNGHGGNHEIAQLVARDLATQLPLRVAVASWWAAAGPELEKLVGNRAVAIPGHAGAFETSIAMAINRSQFAPVPATPSGPERGVGGVDVLRKRYRLEANGWLGTLDGYTDNPALASQGLGQRALRVAERVVAECLLDFEAASAQG